MENKCVYKFDNRREIALPGNEEKSIEYAVRQFVSIAQDAIEKRGKFFVAFSGGSTPKRIFEMLATPKYREAIDWSSVYIFWGDERAVPPENPDSNYNMAFKHGLSKLPINRKLLYRMKAENSIIENAAAYEKEIKMHLPSLAFDLVMLGMGDDGHTASLFPNTNALDISDQLVVANKVPQKSCMRMTFTFTLINKARNISIYVLGDGKSHRASEVLTDKTNSFPSARVGTPSSIAQWIMDENASKDLMKIWNPNGNPKKAM